MALQSNSRTFKGDFGRDEFQREKIALNVIKLLTSDINLSPMIIDGDWGTGKTEFCFKLINKLRDENKSYRILYIDAFQADHADNPLMTLLSSVMELLPEGTEKNSLVENALPIVRFGLATAGKAVIAHTLKQNTEELAAGMDKVLQTAAEKALDASLKTLLKDHEKAKENLRSLQNSLENIARSSSIVIFIDELDRCRPDFAIHFLEVIKHTFNVEGLKFVLVTNTKQLKASINHRYGQQVNAQRYLDKFLKFSFPLPDFVPGRTDRDDQPFPVSVEHFSNLVENSIALKDATVANRGEATFKFTQSLIAQSNPSLREIETFIRHLEIYQTLSNGLTSNTILGYHILSIVGIFIFCLHPDIAESIQRNRSDAKQIAALFGLSSLPNYKSEKLRYSYTMSIAVSLARDSSINADAFITDDAAENDYWKTSKQDYFRTGYSTPTNMFEPVKRAMIFLRLGSE